MHQGKEGLQSSTGEGRVDSYHGKMELRSSAGEGRVDSYHGKVGLQSSAGGDLVDSYRGKEGLRSIRYSRLTCIPSGAKITVSAGGLFHAVYCKKSTVYHIGKTNGP
jgi:hypothetical protein